MLKVRRRWLWSGMALCAVAIALAVIYGSRSPGGQVAETEEAFEERTYLLSLFDRAEHAGDLDYNSAEAREAAREPLVALRARLAQTGVAYDFAWRAHRSAADVAAIEEHDADEVPSDDPRHWLDHFDGMVRTITLVRPGIWLAQPPGQWSDLGDKYMIRVAARFPRLDRTWQAEASFRLAPSVGVAESTLKCAVNQRDGSHDVFAYCFVPAPQRHADAAADAAFLDRLTALQSGGPEPVMTGAQIATSLEAIRWGELAVGYTDGSTRRGADVVANKRRQRAETIATVAIYVIGGLILVGLPAIALASAIRGRRSSLARKGSGVFGVICACLAGGAVYLAGQTGPWGLLISIGLIIFALSAGLAALIGLVGAARGQGRE